MFLQHSALLHLTFFFFNDTATTEIYPLSLHDALPIYISAAHATARVAVSDRSVATRIRCITAPHPSYAESQRPRSEEHTSELQSRRDLVCRLLLEKKKKKKKTNKRRARKLT